MKLLKFLINNSYIYCLRKLRLIPSEYKKDLSYKDINHENMAKKKINYSDLSNKELELLKDIYVDLKVKSMNINELKDFAFENISLQIKNTIGNDEELEAWQEMEEFFKDEFLNTIQDIQLKMSSKNDALNTINIKEKEPPKGGTDEDKKLDMWED